MDFDEYEYLEKTVEGTDNGADVKENPEKGYRRRDRDDDHVEDDELEYSKISTKKSRSDDYDEENGKGKDRERHRDRDKVRERSSRDKSRERGNSLDSSRERGESRDRSRERAKSSDRRRERSRDRDLSRERAKSSDRRRERSRDRDLSRDTGESRDRSRERAKSSDRRRERSRDRDLSRERGESRDRSRDRRDRDREKERSSRDRERERREREKSRERERERERERRSRSRSLHARERERELLRERERELEELRESRRYKDKKETVEPEADPERDQRTVFAYQMPLKATERDVYEFFSKAGKVRDVRLIMDRNSRRSKGVGYIEFYDVMSVPMAIAMTGQLLLGQPVMVKPSEAEKNLVQSNASGGSSVVGPYGATERKLYVGNLHFNMTELQLKQIFEAFGPVELIQLPLDPETGHCKGFGFVQFAQLEHAKAAQNLNGTLEIAGRTIKVSSVTDHIAVQDSGAKTADFDDDEGGGLALNAQSRALLMQKLDRSGFASSVVGSIGAPVLNGAATSQLTTAMPIVGTTAIPAPILTQQVLTSMAPEPIGNPSECLLLKNMFDPATETDPEFDLDIKDDVQEECSKYGHVKHIHVDKNSAGYVYLRFDNVEGASRAQQAMHRRWFARKLISAIYLQPYEYDAKFKGAA